MDTQMIRTSQHHWLLTRIATAAAEADAALSHDGYHASLDDVRSLGEQLGQWLPLEGTLHEQDLRRFVDYLTTITASGRAPEDRELLGLIGWADLLADRVATHH